MWRILYLTWPFFCHTQQNKIYFIFLIFSFDIIFFEPAQTSPKLNQNFCLCSIFRLIGCSLNIVFFSKNSLKFATSPSRQHSAASGCTKYYQPTVHSHCVESPKVSYNDVGEEGEGEWNCEKTQFFPITLYMIKKRFVWLWRKKHVRNTQEYPCLFFR